MTNHPNRSTQAAYYYVAAGMRYSHVKGLDAAHARLAEYLGTTPEDVAKNRRRLAGLIQRVSAAKARAVGLD